MAEDRQRYEQAMSKGAQFAWESQWREAIFQYELALSEFPTEPAPYARLGQAYFELAEYHDSMRYYQQAARLDPSDVGSLGRIADILERMGKLNEAARTYVAVAEANLRARDLNTAVSYWERATRLEPDLIGAHQRLAIVYQRLGRTQESVREHLALARVYQAQGNIQQAATVCKAALGLDPHNPDVLAAVELLRQGMAMAVPEAPAPPTDALPRMSEATFASPVEMDAQPPDVGQESENAGREDGPGGPVDEARQAALADLAEAIFEDETGGPVTAMSKADLDALLSKAIDHQTRGAIDEAIDAYENAIAGGVHLPAAHFNLGLLYQERLRLDEAIVQLQRSVNEPEYKLGSHYALGECYRAKGQYDDAQTHFLEVAKIVDMRTVRHDQAEDLVRLYESLAGTYADKGEREQAIAFSNTLVEFLGTRGWEDKVKEARERLDALAEGGQTMSLAEILAVPGSEILLQSISMTNEYARRDWLDTALEESYRAIQLAPFYLPGHVRLARLLEQRGAIAEAGAKYVTVSDVYRARGDHSRAVDALERAVAISPLDMALRSRLIELFKRRGEIDKALEHLIAQAEAYYQLAQIDKARDKYNDALELAPRGSPQGQWPIKVLHRIADIDMQRLSWRDAVAAYYQIVRMSADDERASVTLVELLYKLGKESEALTELDRFLAALASQGKRKKIMAVLNDLVQQQYNNMDLLNRLAAAYVQAGEREQAIEHLDRLGELQLGAGLRAEAANTIRAILSLRPAEAQGYRDLLAQITGQA